MRISKPIGVLAASIMILGSLVMAGSPAGASPHTLYVGKSHCSDVGPGTSKVPYCTIQEAVTAASTGTDIEIGAGTYIEQVVIGSGKNNLTLDGHSWNDTVISAPGVLTSSKSIVQISTSTGVTIENLKISGPGGGACDSLEYGVRIVNGGQATILNDRITNITDSPLGGCQNGVAILVGHQSESTTGSAVINGDIITNYQKTGIEVSNTGSDATISNNTITGIGPTPIIAQNGIEIVDGATATLANNVVKANVYSPQTVASTGILLIDPGVVKLSGNTANSNDVNLYVVGMTNSLVTTNVTNSATYNGIYVDPTSTGNSFRNNSARGTTAGAGNFDMEDDSTGAGTAGTANTWQNNVCSTALPAGICGR
jgi:hypothetical protein